jgi:uncharacterized protein YndB with AHSA1/START domain
MSSTLTIERRFRAVPERVFAAFTDPEVLRRWWAAAPGWETPVAEVDARPGGRYRCAMKDPAAPAPDVVVGTYVEVVPPERLVYTWGWEGDPPEQAGSLASLVTVEFQPDGEGTRVRVVHTGFETDVVRDQHAHGWNGCLDNLQRKGLA